MKKILLGVTAFTLLLTSCQKSEVVDDVNAGKGQLNFGIYQGKASRAGELTNAAFKKDGVNFSIYAYKGKQTEVKELYFHDTLTYKIADSDWHTNKPRFLADDQKPLQFYAFYAPGSVAGNVPGAVYAAPSNLSGDTYPTLTYAIQKNASGALTNPDGADMDLVAASVNDNSSTSIIIPFKHILSQVNFGVKGYYGAQITINNIEIKQVLNDGIFSFAPAWGWARKSTTKSDYKYTFAGGTNTFKTPGGVYNSTTKLWENLNTEEDIRYILGDGGSWGPGKLSDIWYVTGDQNATIQGTKIADGTPKLTNALMLMPQELEAGTTNAYVTFNYTIQDLDNKTVIGPVVGKFDLNMGELGNAYADQWKSNLRYVYIIDFTGYLDGQLLSFTVDVESQPWENYDGTGGTGIVLLSSLGQPIFAKSIKPLTNGQSCDTLNGNVFSNIAWDWSSYTMNNTFAKNQSFTVKFTDVKFNGNTITIKPPFGFTVSDPAGKGAGIVDKSTQVLTFTSQGYYADVITLNTTLATDGNHELYVSNIIKIKDVDVSKITGSNKVILHFVTPYNNVVPDAWKLSGDRKTATYTVVVP